LTLKSTILRLGIEKIYIYSKLFVYLLIIPFEKRIRRYYCPDKVMF